MFWGVVLENGKRYAQKVESSYHLTMATLDLAAKKKGQKLSVVLEQNKTEFILCNLDYDKQTHQQLDLVFDADEEVTFFLNGEGTVHLTGYVLPDEEYDEFEDESMDEESIGEETDLVALNKLIEDRKRKNVQNEVASKKAKVEGKQGGKGDAVEKKAGAAKTKQDAKKAPVVTKVEDSDEEASSDDEELDEELIKKLMKSKSFDEDDDDDDEDVDDDDEFSDEDDEKELKKYKEEIKKQLGTPKGIIKHADEKKAEQKTVSPNKQQQKKQDGKTPQKQQQPQSAKKQDGKTPQKGMQQNQVNGKAGTPNPHKKKGGSPFSPNANGNRSFNKKFNKKN